MPLWPCYWNMLLTVKDRLRYVTKPCDYGLGTTQDNIRKGSWYHCLVSQNNAKSNSPNMPLVFVDAPTYEYSVYIPEIGKWENTPCACLPACSKFPNRFPWRKFWPFRKLHLSTNNQPSNQAGNQTTVFFSSSFNLYLIWKVLFLHREHTGPTQQEGIPSCCYCGKLEKLVHVVAQIVSTNLAFTMLL